MTTEEDTRLWDRTRRDVDKGIRKFFPGRFPDVSSAMDILGPNARDVGEHVKHTDGQRAIVHGELVIMRMMVNDQGCLESFKKYDLLSQIQARLVGEGVVQEVSNQSPAHQNNHGTEFNIVMKPRLLGGIPPASTPQTKGRTTKTKQTIRDLLIGGLCSQTPKDTDLGLDDMQTADGIDASANTRITPNPVEEAQQDGPHADDSVMKVS